ncbi:MAG TPA: hypothetical protein VFL98_00480 [Candidatus Paceibacterota bacterium]|nr:hypothetical protein [Candidatus Paceibacterota bacterium]
MPASHRRFNPWHGLGPALRDANEQYGTVLMPDAIADAAQSLANEYGSHPELRRLFEQRMEHWIAVEFGDMSDDEMHAAKHAVGAVFAANRADDRHD